MASITTERNGRRAIQFVAGDGKRRTIRLGKIDRRNAEATRVHVERLAIATATHGAPPLDTADWLMRISDTLHARIRAVGLTGERRPSVSRLPGVLAYVDSYITGRTDLKAATVLKLRQTRAALARFFTDDRRIDEVSPADGKDFRRHLVGEGYSEASIATYVRVCRRFFGDAVDRELLRRNPFHGVQVGSFKSERTQFVDAATIHKVIDAAPSAEWRAMIALSRFGGLRVPSELLPLRWADIDWDNGKVLVRSPKTERQGKSSRIVPLFPELRRYLMEAFEVADEGAEFVVGRYRDATQNLRTHFERIITRAGVKPWPRLWHNLRASRQTELAAKWPLHVVCNWIGNTKDIAAEHYLRVTDADYAAASCVDSKIVDVIFKPGAESGAVGGGTDPHDPANTGEIHNESPGISSAIDVVRSPAIQLKSREMVRAGIEPATLRFSVACSTN
jgi:integrase